MTKVRHQALTTIDQLASIATAETRQNSRRSRRFKGGHKARRVVVRSALETRVLPRRERLDLGTRPTPCTRSRHPRGNRGRGRAWWVGISPQRQRRERTQHARPRDFTSPRSGVGQHAGEHEPARPSQRAHLRSDVGPSDHYHTKAPSA